MFPIDMQNFEEEPSFTAWYSKKRQRSMFTPNAAMRTVHKELTVWLKKLSVKMPHAHAFVEERSSLTNATVHQHGRYFYITDLTDAYGTLQPEMVAEVLVELSAELSGSDLTRVEHYLAKYCFLPSGGLYTGGPASPILFNIYCTVRLDAPLSRYCAARGLTYSRYADDLAFSSRDTNIGSSKRNKIRQIIRQAGFEPHPRKTRINLDLYKAPIRVAGVLLHWNGPGRKARMTAPPAQRERARAVLGMALRGDVSPAVGHGHAGAVLAVTKGPEGHETSRLRADQGLLKLQRRRT